MIGRIKCWFGFHRWQLLAICTTRATILAPFTTHGGERRVCIRCRLYDDDMLNCSHGHCKLEPSRS